MENREVEAKHDFGEALLLREAQGDLWKYFSKRTVHPVRSPSNSLYVRRKNSLQQPHTDEQAELNEQDYPRGESGESGNKNNVLIHGVHSPKCLHFEVFNNKKRAIIIVEDLVPVPNSRQRNRGLRRKDG